MDTREDSAVGIIPVYKKGDAEFLFCIVKEADGHWGFPKGHKEEGESDEEAALRELREETGIEKVDLIREQKFSEHYSFVRDEDRVEKTVVYIIGIVDTTEHLRSPEFRDEISECKWVPYAHAKQTLTYPEAREVLDRAWEYMQKSLK